MRKTFYSALACGLFLVSGGHANAATADRTPPATQATPSGQAASIMAALTARSRAVRAYHADVTMHVRMHSFPYVRLTYPGKADYTYPGHFSAAFRAPRKLAEGYEKAFKDVGDPSTWAQRYTIQLDQASSPSDRDVAVLRLTPVNDPSVDHTLAYVNTKSLTVQEYVWYYRNGGRIDMKQTFAPVQGTPMATRQDIDVNLPSVKVSLEADVSNYVVQFD